MKSIEFIPNIKSYNIIEKIAEGHSGDDKYKIEKNGRYFLLRVGSKTEADIKLEEFNRLKLIEGKGINTHIPIEFDIICDKFYSIVSWVNGTPIMDVIKANLKNSHYEIGKKVGIELKKLHDISITDLKINWFSEIQKKSRMLLDRYDKMKIEFTGSKSAKEYITNNISIVKDRPTTILHGDFHWINCVINDENQIGIIDFSGNAIGDPWYDFTGMLWVLEYSDSFANGQLDGYFGTTPKDFWKIFKLYTAMYAFEHLLCYNGNTYNASRILKIFGENFQEDVPLFRKSNALF